MARNLGASKIYRFITRDFEDTWNALTKEKLANGRGNFLFALQAMILLEVASKVCNGHPKKRIRFSRELESVNKRYFTQIKGMNIETTPCGLPTKSPANPPKNELLWALFDLIRHGEAHQYQQVIVPLSDRRNFGISISGADYGQGYGTPNKKRRDEHLGYVRKGKTVWVKVHPDVLMQDLREAIDRSHLFNKNTRFKRFQRPFKGTRYDFDSKTLLKALKGNGHMKLK